jgi:hypothetical protein
MAAIISKTLCATIAQPYRTGLRAGRAVGNRIGLGNEADGDSCGIRITVLDGPGDAPPLPRSGGRTIRLSGASIDNEGSLRQS